MSFNINEFRQMFENLEKNIDHSEQKFDLLQDTFYNLYNNFKYTIKILINQPIIKEALRQVPFDILELLNHDMDFKNLSQEIKKRIYYFILFLYYLKKMNLHTSFINVEEPFQSNINNIFISLDDIDEIIKNNKSIQFDLLVIEILIRTIVISFI